MGHRYTIYVYSKLKTYLGHSVCSCVKQESSTVQEEGLTNEGRHHLLLLHTSKQVHDKRELLHVYINGTQLTACEHR